MVAEVRAFARYLTRPRRTIREARIGTVSQRWLIALGSLMVLDLAVLLPLALLADRFGLSHRLDDVSPPYFFVVGVLIAPCVEELVFRAGLRSSRYSVFIGPALVGLVCATARTTVLVALAALGLGLVAMAVCARRLRRPGARMAYARRYVKRFPWVFFGYAAAFGLVHASNWTVPSAGAWLMLPMLVLPQLFFGLIAGYLRIRDSLRSAIALHMVANLLVLSVGLAGD